MIFDTGSIFLYLVGIFLLYLFCRIFLKPIKWLMKLALSCLLGGVGILACNWIFGALGWHIALNPLTAMITGVMGIPGMIMAQILTTIL
ncbi:MAG: pro-sigmaK processing inhibitor BofA family protein [Clostridia bacterium]|nr:pro-sigmaK processing inhibitor BofA family protein [Clostridia bacterium]